MQINVSERIDRAPIGPYQVRVVALCALIALLDGFDIQAMALVVPHLAAQWKLPAYSFGPVLSASLAGIMLGATTCGILGDRHGRKSVLMIMFTLVGLSSLSTALAQTPGQLMVLRFLTGLGIGGCMPNFTALTSEYVASRHQSFGVTVMFSAVPLGGLLAGYFAGDIIDAFGWRAIFIGGGAFPLLVAALMYFGLPESLHFLVKRGDATARVARILERVDPGYRRAPGHQFIVDSGATGGGSLKALFETGRTTTTLTLWAVFFCSLFGMYVLTSWLPTLFSQQGWPMARAAQTISFFWLGGIVGGWVVGWMMDRIGAQRALAIAFAAAAVLVVSIGFSGNSVERVMTLLVLIGFTMVGAQTGTTAFAASFYPPAARSTGVGWGLGLGRLGAVIGPLLASIALSAQWSGVKLFAAAAVPPLLCSLMMVALSLMRSRAADRRDASGAQIPERVVSERS